MTQRDATDAKEDDVDSQNTDDDMNTRMVDHMMSAQTAQSRGKMLQAREEIDKAVERLADAGVVHPYLYEVWDNSKQRVRLDSGEVVARDLTMAFEQVWKFVPDVDGHEFDEIDKHGVDKGVRMQDDVEVVVERVERDEHTV